MQQPSSTHLLAMLDEWRTQGPDDLMVTDYDVAASRAAGGLVKRSATTVRQMWDLVSAAAAGLRAMGVGRGDVVAIQLPTWHEYMAAHLAVHAIGAVTMPISPIYREREVSRQLELGAAVALIIPGGYGSFDYAQMASQLQVRHPTLKHVIVVGEQGGGHQTWAQLLREGERAAVPVLTPGGPFTQAPDEFTLLNFTSGTTGVPKGVMHSVATLTSAVAAASDRLEITREDVILIAVTIGHAAGFLNGVYMPLMRKARAVYIDLWDAGVALEVIECERTTYGPMMPTFLFDLVRNERFDTADLSSLTRARVSGGAISRPVMESLQLRQPALKLMPGWGLSEALYLTCGSPSDPPRKLSETDGRTLAHATVEIRDRTLTKPLGPNEDGEIVVRAPSVMLGYYRQEQLTRDALTADGYLITGDIGHFDPEGYLVMVGRSKEIVVRGGENVPIVEVENLLMEHPKVETACVIGIPDARLGEKVCAVIVPADSGQALELQEMREFLIGRQLTRQFIPESIVHMASVPKTPLGKIRRIELRQHVLAQMAL